MGPRGDVRRRSGAGRVWLLTGCLFLGAGLLWMAVSDLRAPLSGRWTVPLWLLAASFAVAEIFVMHVRIARHAHSFSLAELPLVIGLAFVSPGALVITEGVGVTIALAAHRRQKPLRLVFNVAQRACTTLLAVAIVASCRALLPGGWPSLWLSMFLATLAADVLGGILINLAISLSEGSLNLFDQVLGMGTALTLVNTALALVAVMVVLQHPAALVFVAAPAATTYLAGKAVNDLQRKHRDVVQLQRATSLAQRSLRTEDMVPVLLGQMREMFEADVAELVVWPENHDGTRIRYQIGPGDERTGSSPVSLDLSEGVWARVVSEREAILLPRPIRNEALRRFFEDRSILDAMVAPLISDDQLLGIITVANRLGDFSTFGEDDIELMRTLANHVAVAVRNSLLLGRLELSLAHETDMSRLKDEFVATVSHELRTPITNVQGFVKTLLRPDVRLTSEEQREFLMAADRNAERLKRLIEDLLFAARVESGDAGAKRTDVIGLAGLLDRVVDDEAQGDLRARLHVLMPDRVPPVVSVEEDVYLILRNLVDNALKYSPDEERVTVSVGLEADGVVVRVRDRGPGIEPAEQGRIFDRFYQVDGSATRRVGGVGMGLYICRRAAERLGARLWLDQSDASGSVFAVWFPIDEGTDDSSTRHEDRRIGAAV